MEFFWIIVSNLFTGAIVYLLLSLKIERSSPSILEQKLKREMNEIMVEFNAAAERNITLLEGKIKQAQNISQSPGRNRHVDYVVSDEIGKKSDSLPAEQKSEKSLSQEVDFKSKIGPVVDTESNDLTSTKAKELISREVKPGENMEFIIEEDIDLSILADDENPEELIKNSENKYSAVGELFSKGYSVEEISKFSGIPAGEIRLVLQLNI